jgi:hypothetical protein
LPFSAFPVFPEMVLGKFQHHAYSPPNYSLEQTTLTAVKSAMEVRPSNLQCQRPKKEPWICDTWDLCMFLICFGSQKRHERAWKGHFTAFGSHQTTSVSRIIGSRKDLTPSNLGPSHLPIFADCLPPLQAACHEVTLCHLLDEQALHCHDDHGMYMRSFIKSHNFRACGLDMLI